MNISSAILDMYKIGPMTLEDYKDFIYSTGGKTKKYRTKLSTNKNGILVQNLRNGKPFLLGCVKDYYSPCPIPLTGVSNCNECRSRLEIDDSVPKDCLMCHRYCFEQYNNRHLNRITNNKK